MQSLHYKIHAYLYEVGKKNKKERIRRKAEKIISGKC
jgi:hypothetical protein